jgi:hypothetical protein
VFGKVGLVDGTWFGLCWSSVLRSDAAGVHSGPETYRWSSRHLASPLRLWIVVKGEWVGLSGHGG